MTSVATLTEWFEAGKSDPKNTHMIVMCDTYDGHLILRGYNGCLD